MSTSSPPDAVDLLSPDLELERSGRRGVLSSRPWLMVVAQFFPVIGLAAAYPSVVSRLTGTSLGGAPLSVLIVTCAVITPTLAQAVAAPVYLHLLGDRAKDPRFVSRAVLRAALPAVVVVGPLVLAVAAAAAAARQLPAGAAFELLGLLLLHVVMGALMVPAYALRAPLLLVVPWAVYIGALLIAPAIIWLPALVATAASSLVLLIIAVRRPARDAPSFERLHVGLGAAFIGALRGAAEGLPLWSVPVVVWLIDVRLDSVGFIYIALLPGVMAHQLFFVRVVDPAWLRIEDARGSLSTEPYGVARARFDRFGRLLLSGIGQAAVLLVILSLVLVAAAVGMHWAHEALLLVIVLAAGAAVAAMMQSYAIAMIGTTAPLVVLGSGTLSLIVVGVALRLPEVLVLGAAAAFDLVCAAVLSLLVSRALRFPEYALFWRRAVAA